MSVLLQSNLNPLLAMSVAGLVGQAVVTLILLGFYHVWMTGRKQAAPPAPAAHQAPTPVAPAPPIVSNVAVNSPASVVPPPVVQIKPESVPAEIAAVIAAAVASVLDRPHRVLSVHHIGVPMHRFNVWAHEGRQHIFDSHKFR